MCVAASEHNTAVTALVRTTSLPFSPKKEDITARLRPLALAAAAARAAVGAVAAIDAVLASENSCREAVDIVAAEAGPLPSAVSSHTSNHGCGHMCEHACMGYSR